MLGENMTVYAISYRDSQWHIPQFPERTSKKNSPNIFEGWKIYRICSSRTAMVKAIRKQEKNEKIRCKYEACIPLKDNEGY